MTTARRWLLWVALALASVATAGPVAWYAVMRAVQFDLHQPRNLLLGEQAKLQLSTLGQARMLSLDRWKNRDRTRVLTLRQAEFAFYSRVRYISHIDPRMVPFFQARSVDAAFRELRKLGITHVSIPEEPLPTLYNSFLEEIVNSGRFVRRRDHFGGSTLCELFDEPLEAARQGDAMRIGRMDWTPWSAKDRYSVPTGVFSAINGAPVITNQPMISANAREVRLSSGQGPIDVIPQFAGSNEPLLLQFGKEYLIESDLRGEGLVLVEVHLYVDDTPQRIVQVWQGYLSGRARPLRSTFTQDAVSPKCVKCRTATARIVIRLLSRGEVAVGVTTIRESGVTGGSSSIERAQAENKGWVINSEHDMVRWGLTSAPANILYLQHAGGYPASFESSAFAAAEDRASVELSLQMRGTGRFFTELRCAQDERASAMEISADVTWLAHALSGSARLVRDADGVAGTAIQKTAAVFAAPAWTPLKVNLAVPDCAPLADGAVVNRLNEAGTVVAGNRLLRLAFITRREVDYSGRLEEFPQIELRDIAVTGHASADDKEAHGVVRL